MTEQYRPNLGELVEGTGFRDAVHIAVAPVVAGMPLDPGDHVWLEDGFACKECGSRNEKTIGVVDPFLSTIVMRGQMFWLVLYPNTVANLRHVWTHPAFKMQPPKGVP